MIVSMHVYLLQFAFSKLLGYSNVVVLFLGLQRTSMLRTFVIGDNMSTYSLYMPSNPFRRRIQLKQLKRIFGAIGLNSAIMKII